jgi:hypothetical protein
VCGNDGWCTPFAPQALVVYSPIVVLADALLAGLKDAAAGASGSAGWLKLLVRCSWLVVWEHGELQRDTCGCW